MKNTQKNNNKIKIYFFASPSIALNSLEYLLNCEDIDILGVISQPDKPQGRGNKILPTKIKSFALEHNLPVFTPQKIRQDNELLNILKENKPDFFITFAFGQILSQEVLDIPKFGTVNLHASLLPEYRGANPIARAISDGKTKTGITTMLTSLGVDEGDILLREEIDIDEDMTTSKLSEIIAQKSPQLLYKTITEMFNNKLTPQKQNHNEATFAAKFSKEDMFLDFQKSAKTLHNLTRALDGNAKIQVNNKTVKIIKTSYTATPTIPAGKIIKTDKEGVQISTGEGILILKKVKPEGKNEMGAFAWSNGVNLKNYQF